ncbi:MAG: flagellar hook-length control protein FliK [Paracoccaceae bacterium]
MLVSLFGSSSKEAAGKVQVDTALDENGEAHRFAERFADFIEDDETSTETHFNAELELPAETVASIDGALDELMLVDADSFVFNGIEAEPETTGVRQPESVALLTEEVAHFVFDSDVEPTAKSSAEDGRLLSAAGSTNEVPDVDSLFWSNVMSSGQPVSLVGREQPAAGADKVQPQYIRVVGTSSSQPVEVASMQDVTSEIAKNAGPVETASMEALDFEAQTKKLSEQVQNRSDRADLSIKTSNGDEPGIPKTPDPGLMKVAQMSFEMPIDPGDIGKTSEPDIIWDTNRQSSALPQDSRGLIARMELPADVARNIAEILHRRGDGQIEIALNPKELGSIRMSIVAAELGVVVSIAAERPETLDLMRRNIDGLGREFAELGYEDISFTFSGGDSQGANTDDPKEQSAENDLILAMGDREIVRAPSDTLQSVAVTGVDIRL